MMTNVVVTPGQTQGRCPEVRVHAISLYLSTFGFVFVSPPGGEMMYSTDLDDRLV